MSREFLALLVLLCTCGCGASFRVKPAVVFVGDSITFNWSSNWAGQQATFTQNNWLDVGVIGFTSSQIAAGFDAYAVDLQPQVVHILAGTNDVYPGWQPRPTTTLRPRWGRPSPSHRRGENYIPALTLDGVHPSSAGYAVITPHSEQALQVVMAAGRCKSSPERGDLNLAQDAVLGTRLNYWVVPEGRLKR
jgi:lysophospholipase L1-like esterase